MALDIVKLRALQPSSDRSFKIRRLGHVVLQVTDLERSLLFYTQVLGFKATEIYSKKLQPGGFAFLRCHTDHHSIAWLRASAAIATEVFDKLPTTRNPPNRPLKILAGPSATNS